MEIQKFCQAWDLCRAGRPMPQRADINLAGLAGAFSGVLLAERVSDGQDPPAHRYLPVSSLGDAGNPNQARWLDPALFQHIPVSGCHVVSATGEPHLERVSLLSGDGLLLDYEIIFLPLAPAGGSADGIVDATLVLAIELPPAA